MQSVVPLLTGLPQQTINKALKDVEKFMYLETTGTHQDAIHNDMKIRLNSGSAYSSSLQSLLSSYIS